MFVLTLILLIVFAVLAVLSRFRQRPSSYRIDDAADYLRQVRAEKAGLPLDEDMLKRVPGDFIPAKDTYLGPGSGFIGAASGGRMPGLAYFGRPSLAEIDGQNRASDVKSR
jgi:hypothetical protein